MERHLSRNDDDLGARVEALMRYLKKKNDDSRHELLEEVRKQAMQQIKRVAWEGDKAYWERKRYAGPSAIFEYAEGNDVTAYVFIQTYHQ